MRNVANLMIVGLGLLGACSKQPADPAATRTCRSKAISPMASFPPTPDRDAAARRSSVTSSGELNSGDDNPDVNDLGNSH